VGNRVKYSQNLLLSLLWKVAIGVFIEADTLEFSSLLIYSSYEQVYIHNEFGGMHID